MAQQPMSPLEQLLRQGIDAARVGRRAYAQSLLMRVIEEDERNEQAWLWLSGVVDDPEQQRICLENTLEINPHNLQAQRGLAWLNEQHPDGAARAVGQEHGRQAAPIPEQTVTVIPETEPENPCPYCGAPTHLTQKNCTQCSNSLLVRSDPPEKRSLPLVTLVVLWGLSAALTILVGVLGIVGEFATSWQLRAEGQPAPIEPLLGSILGTMLAALIYLSIIRGLWNRRRWAYTINSIVIGGTVLMYMISSAFVLSAAGNLQAGLSSNTEAEGLIGMVSSAMNSLQEIRAGNVEVEGVLGFLLSFLGVFLILGFTIQMFFVALTVLSYRDFYGPKTRTLTEIPKRDPESHYNMGVIYKNKGMWYMASKEWEAAAQKKPNELIYRHALGLAYAQLKKFERAMGELRAALQIAPDDTRLKESLAAIERKMSREQV
jgi:tetratricopeptide (TPR) repeat protein